MPFEGPYEREDAHHEANELRAIIGISPKETGKVPRNKEKEPDRFDRAATAEDYKSALKELRDLQAKAPNDAEIKRKLKELEKNADYFGKEERHGSVI